MNEFIRRLDGLGRIVIPKEYRRTLKINNDSKLKISIENDYIKIEKYSDIDNNIENLEKYVKVLNKFLGLKFIITDLDEDIFNGNILPNELVDKIKYGKIEIINYYDDLLFNSNNKINMIIIPIILCGEIIGSIIGYSYNREINDMDLKILEIVQSILIKNIEE